MCMSHTIAVHGTTVAVHDMLPMCTAVPSEPVEALRSLKVLLFVKTCILIVAGGGVLSVVYMALFHKLGYIANGAYSMMPVIWLTALCATVVEALPVHYTLDDNLTVPVAAAAVGQLLMHGLHTA